jgi:parallel beta-helix repeat protein
MVLSPPFWALAQLSSPDALCLLLVAAALFAFAELRRTGLAVAFLLVAILARPNAALLALFVIGVAALARPSSGVRLRWPLVLGAGGIVVLTVVLLTRLSGNYALGTLFYHGVVAYLPHPALGARALPWSEVLRLYTFRTVQLATSPVPLFALLGVLVLYLRTRSLGEVLDDPVSLAVAAAFGAIVTGWLAYPANRSGSSSVPSSWSPSRSSPRSATCPGTVPRHALIPLGVRRSTRDDDFHDRLTASRCRVEGTAIDAHPGSRDRILCRASFFQGRLLARQRRFSSMRIQGLARERGRHWTGGPTMGRTVPRARAAAIALAALLGLGAGAWQAGPHVAGARAAVADPRPAEAGSGRDSATAAAPAVARYLSPSGSDANPGTFAAPLLTLQRALTKLRPGDTLYVRGGTYNVTRRITHATVAGRSSAPIVITNYPGEFPVFTSSVLQVEYIDFDGGSQYVTVSGLTFKGPDLGALDDNGESLIGFTGNASHITLQGNTFLGSPAWNSQQHLVYFEGPGTDLTVSGNVFDGRGSKGDAITSYHEPNETNVTVTGNTIRNFDQGIVVWSTISGLRITNNTFAGCRIGIRHHNSDGTTVSGNRGSAAAANLFIDSAANLFANDNSW